MTWSCQPREPFCPQCCVAFLKSCPECGDTICPECDGRLCGRCDERQWNEDHYDPNADWDNNDYNGHD